MFLPRYYNDKFREYLNDTKETGSVVQVLHPMLYVDGLPGAKINEVVAFETGQIGFVTSLGREYVEILALSNEEASVDTRVARSNRFIDVPVGKFLLGHCINPLGATLGEEVVVYSGIGEFRPINMAAPGVAERAKITEPFETGVSIVDLMIPLGKGQRELVIGDRKVGKTEFLLQTMLSQARKGTVVVYGSIGKRGLSTKKVAEFVKESGIKDKVIIVSSSASDPLGLIFLTPYVAMTIAEYFRDFGQDTLVILDDLTLHAKYYREMSLIAKKFPGREAYPGDIFYTHSRLLERAGNFKTDKGICSITCLPVAETIAGDITGYIPTNLMSITDGHVFFDAGLFKEGRRPSINHFLSVTRVGRQTQTKLRWSLNRELSSFMILLDKTQNFVHFGAELNEGIKSTLATGDKIVGFFNQPMGVCIPLNVQIVFFCLIWSGFYSDLGAMENTIVNLTTLYAKDKSIRKKIDDLVAESEDLNQLLGTIGAHSKEILNFVMPKAQNVKR